MLEEQPDDLDITEVGRETKMPWEVDGRRWHIHDRVGRKGEPCRWDGRILEAVVDRIQELGTFSETDWNSRSVVEIAAEKKSVGWFFHAITGETWLLKMKFRVAKNTFQRQNLIDRLPFEDAQSARRTPHLRQRTTREVPLLARTVAGSADQFALLGRDRYTRVLVVPGPRQWPASRSSPS